MSENSIPPQLFSQEAEEALIGSVLIDPEAYRLIDLAPGDFYIRRLGHIWQAIGALEKRGHDADFLTVCEELERMGKLAEVGGAAYLTALINRTPTSLHAESYADIVRDKARRRMLLETANKLAKAAHADAANLDETSIQVIEQLSKTSGSRRGSVPLSEALDRLYLDVCERMSNPQDIFGLETGITDFDRMTGGLQPGEALYIGGDPGVGKSILSVQMGVGMAAAGHPGVIYSLEMPESQITRRIASSLAEVVTDHLKSGKVSDDEFTRFGQAVERGRKLPLYLCDEHDQTTSSIRADLARRRAQNGIEWFVLDYLYLLGDSGGKDDVERSEILSRRVKMLCREFDLAGITVNSVLKDGSDIRGSNSVKHDCDILAMLLPHQPDKDRGEREQKNLRTFAIRKGRELALPLSYFHLVKCDQWPAFRNYAPEIAAGKNGRGQYWDR